MVEQRTREGVEVAEREEVNKVEIFQNHPEYLNRQADEEMVD